MITRNPMSARERRAVGGLALLYSFRMLGLFMVLPLLALYTAEIPGATATLIGVAIGIYGLSQAILQIPMGWLSDRIGRKPVILAGLVVFALGSAVAGLAESIEGVILGRFLQGAGAIGGSVMALTADLTRDEQRTKAMAIVGATIGVSFALALVLGPLVAASGGLSSVFNLTAGLAVFGIAIVVFIIPTPSAPVVLEDVSFRLDRLLGVIRDPALLPHYIGVFSLHFILMSTFLLVPGIIEGALLVPREQHWKVYLPVLALSVLGMLPLLRLAERNGRASEVLFGTIVLLLLALVGLTLMRAPILYYVCLVAYFVAVNFLEATLPSAVSKAADPAFKGTALGTYSTFQFMGAFFGGLAGGWALEVGGASWLVLACLVPAAVWLLLSLPGRAATASPAGSGGRV